MKIPQVAKFPSRTVAPILLRHTLKRAASAVAEGDSVLGIHLYLAAYERALRESIMPGEEVLEGMSKAWDLAIKTKQRSLAEYIFEKLEPYWDSNEVSRHADELQRLAFDKLEEYGFDRDAIEGMADMVNQDLMDAAPDMLCRFEESAPLRRRLRLLLKLPRLLRVLRRMLRLRRRPTSLRLTPIVSRQ